jgi:hypothetical protein
MEICFLIYVKRSKIKAQTVFEFGARGLGELVHEARLGSFAAKVPDLPMLATPGGRSRQIFF